MARNTFYDGTGSPSNPLYGTTTSGTEPDIRQELIKMFNGTYPEVAKAQTGLLRKMNRDSDGNKIACECVDNITKEPTRDRFCPICYGEGYIWTETTIQFYKTFLNSRPDSAVHDKLHQAGLINVPLVVFYLRYDCEITEDDKIIQVVLNNDGSTTSPIVREQVFKIGMAWDYRADNGKLEYWALFTSQEDVKYLNSPSYT